MAVATGIGRRMTKVATRCQTPCSGGVIERRHRVRELTRCPSTASMAGSTTTENRPARTATATPA